jgi:short subunit dehydrogenase-like uncharacterized protein
VTDRDLDVVVFGATGVTGRQVAGYLGERASERGLRWAAAAREAGRLARCMDEVGVSPPETIVADVGDPGSLEAMASRARVVLDLVGPYTLYGRPVIEACIANGAHYVDLAGEIPFVRTIIDEFDRPAATAGVKVVQVCGFESLPPDMLILLAGERARERWGDGLAAVDLEATITPPRGLPHPSDGISGGTFQTITAVMGAEDAALVADPAALLNDAAVAAAVRRVSPIALAPRRGSNGAVLGPMSPAAFINPGVIHRTEQLLASADGRAAEPFRYRESMVLGGSAVSLPVRWGIAGILSATQVGMLRLARASPVLRRGVASAISRIGPSSGFGPAADRMQGWRWTMSVHARTTGGRELEVHLQADGHPGYLTTARLLGEVGVLLSEDGATPERAGCLTPAAALGSACVERFERAGARFSSGA